MWFIILKEVQKNDKFSCKFYLVLLLENLQNITIK